MAGFSGKLKKINQVHDLQKQQNKMSNSKANKLVFRYEHS